MPLSRDLPTPPAAAPGDTEAAWTEYRLPRAQPPDGKEPAPPDATMLASNARWFCRLRWIVVAVLSAYGTFGLLRPEGCILTGIRGGGVWALAVAAALAGLNLAYLGFLRATEDSSRRAALATACLWTQIVLDLVLLTVVVHHLGSLETFAPMMYLFHIVLACIFFSSLRSLAVTAIAWTLYLACVAAELAGVVAPPTHFAAPPAVSRAALPLATGLVQAGSVLFISATVWFLTSRIAGALRQREEELAVSNRRLLAATEERARHLLRTTHQLKAPFAAIHAQTQVLLGGYCGTLSEDVRSTVEQIAARAASLSRQIQQMLQLANLRSAAQQPPPRVAVELAAVAAAAVAAHQPAAARRGITIEAALETAWTTAVADHAAMLLDNLVANAVNYSHEGGTVEVSCSPRPGGGATVAVRDRGIGIPAEKLPRVFDDFFRTTEAASHNRNSTGLGLAIVRQAALAGDIDVSIRTAPAAGTVVTLTFPPGAPPGGPIP